MHVVTGGSGFGQKLKFPAAIRHSELVEQMQIWNGVYREDWNG